MVYRIIIIYSETQKMFTLETIIQINIFHNILSTINGNQVKMTIRQVKKNIMYKYIHVDRVTFSNNTQLNKSQSSLDIRYIGPQIK